MGVDLLPEPFRPQSTLVRDVAVLRFPAKTTRRLGTVARRLPIVPPMSAPRPSSNARTVRLLLCAAACLALGALPGIAQDNDMCLMCHEDTELTGRRAGDEISVHVDARDYASSVHAQLDCVTCHQDLDPENLPHADDVEPVDCGFCHDTEAEAHRTSLHGQAAERGDLLAPTCADCHGKHDIRPHTDPESPTSTINIPLLCGRCHHEGSPVSLTHDIPQDRILENYSLSIHGEGIFQKGLTVTAVCTSCHTSHRILPHTDPESSIHADNVVTTCTACHARIEQVHTKVIEGRLWEEEPHKIPVCVDCHSPHKIRRVLYPQGMANQDCLKCHADPNLTMERDGQLVSLFVDDDIRSVAAHGGTACAQCHTDVSPSRTRPCETVASAVDCSVCHAEQVSDYGTGLHGSLHAAGDPDAPACLDCHDKHAILKKTVPTSPTFARNVPMLCSKCHRAGEQAAVRIDSDVPDIVRSYEDSIHGKGLLRSGLTVTATCASCHTAHRELPPDDPRSSVNSNHVADTCGQCHHGIEETFRTSVHWPGNAETDRELPTCENCHSSHTITRTDNPDFRFRMMDQCGRCHENEATSFFDTFHGKASRLGSAGAAKCYDCHGTHDILPVSDPDSALSRDNVVETCGQCHEASHRRFAGYLTHATHHDPDKYPFLFWSFWAMTVLLVGTLTVALIHTLAWLVRLWLTRDEWKAHKALAKTGNGKLYRRFDRRQRSLHMAMLLSFFTLALTGMTLKFSYMVWAQALARFLGGFQTLGTLHRMGAIALFVVFALHLWDVRRRKLLSGKSWWHTLTGPDSILPSLRDLREARQSILWFFGLGSRPAFGRYTYWEKFDYFAVFWGIAIIGSTGLLLWFPELFTRVFPGWSVNVATIIHSDEALLAVGFIFTIHFFNTHFRPDKFPMDPVIFTGRVTVDELRYDKPAEYEQLVADGTLEDHLVDPLPEPVVRGFKIFGFIALGIGLTLIAFIVYTMIFGYR
jgi:cytochrome b subunit of formate dehydrogenase